MSHFEYLIRDEDTNFFQKVAEEVACQIPPSPFEKVAARLDTDIHFIKTAGPCGSSFGATDRGYDYLDNLYNADRLLPDEFLYVFDKVAGAGLEADINAIQSEWHQRYPEEIHGLVDKTAAELGLELSKIAMLDKEAILKALHRIGTGIATRGAARSAATGAQIGKGFSAVGRGLKKSWQGIKFGLSGKGIQAAKRDVRAGMVRNKMKSLDVAAKSNLAKQRGVAGDAYRKSLHEQRLTQKADVKGLIQKDPELAGVVKARNRADIAKGQAAGTRPPPKTKTEAPKQKVEEPKPAAGDKSPGQAADDAAGAAQGGPPPSTVPAAAEGATATLGGAWKNFNEKGWSQLSSAEKSKLVAAGVATVAGHRLVTGRDVVSGDKAA